MGTESINRALFAQSIIDDVAIYAAFTEQGYVKIGISRTPLKRVYTIHCNSPFPIAAVQFAWVGSKQRAASMERKLWHTWKDHSTRGEWYFFDYAKDKAMFHAQINRVFYETTGRAPRWHKVSQEQTKEWIEGQTREGLGKIRA